MSDNCQRSPYVFPFTPCAEDGWRIDWEGVCARFDAVRQLSGCPQDPLHHAEGDVLTHTQAACEALAVLPAWRALPEEARSIVFAATLLHDIAKPHCTRQEHGRITSRGHALKGAQLARCLLWEAWPQESSPEFFQMREAVVGLVRHHGLPLYFLERADPRRAVIEASISARLDWAGILATADVLGRTSSDQQELLDRLAMFREFAGECGCLRGPYSFASDYSRIRYFRNSELPPAIDLYDDSRSEVTLMSGLPASGKDTWIQQNAAGKSVISLDHIRSELEIAPQDPQGAVAQEARQRARTLLASGQPFVWNATNTTRMARRPLIDLCSDYRARVRIVYVETSAEELLRRNRRREKPVPENVLARLRQRLEIPDLTEAHRLETVMT